MEELVAGLELGGLDVGELFEQAVTIAPPMIQVTMVTASSDP